MNERRNSKRVELNDVWVKEENGDFHRAFKAKDISEEGIFLEGRMVYQEQEPTSKITLTLPQERTMTNITVTMVREQLRGEATRGAAFQFENVEEARRIDLKKFVVKKEEPKKS